MALNVVEFLRSVNPNIGLVVNPDGSYRIGVEDVNSDEILAAVVALAYAGQPYSNTDTAGVDTVRRFEVATLILRDAVIKVSTNNQLFGEVDAQNFELAAGGSMALSYLDLSLFYFRNAAAGQNGTVQILGTRV